MDGFAYLLIFIALAFALFAWQRFNPIDRRLKELSAKLAGLETEVARLRGHVPEAGADVPAAVAETAAAEPETVPEPIAAAAVAPKRMSRAWGGKGDSGMTEAVEAPPAPSPAEPLAPDRGAAARGDMEKTLASKWFVWIGGAAIAIGGLLFVKYAHDNGLLPPAFRIIVGLLFGAVLVAAAEYLRRKPLKGFEGQTYVPAALSAGGLVIAFGSIFAAYALYGLIAPLTAFAGLALVALGAIALSLVQGPLIAALGLIGAYVAPALISTEDPNAGTFFPYVLIVLAASLAILKQRPWWWLGFSAIGGAFAWSLLWILGGVFESGDILPVGLAAIALGALAVGLGHWAKAPLAIAAAGLAAALLTLMTLTGTADHDVSAVILLLAGGLATALYAMSARELDVAAPAAAAAVFFTLVVWRDASFFTMAMDETGLWQSVAGPGQGQFFRWMLIAGAAFGALGLFGTLRLARPWLWAGMGAGALVLFGFGAWARLPEFVGDGLWIAGALAVVAALGFVFLVLAKRLEDTEANLAMGLLSGGSVLAGLFALDRGFDRVWLTLSMSVLVPLIALLWRRFPVRLLPYFAMGLAALVALKLLTAHDIWFREGALAWGDHWVLYGYGVPAALFLLSSRLFAGAPRAALEGGALALLIALASLEIRVLIGGGFTEREADFLEVAAHIMAWLGAGFGLLWRQGLFSSVVSKWGARVLIAASIAGIVLFSLGALNPVVTEDWLPGNALFNPLLLAYLAPAALLAVIAQRLAHIGWERARIGFGVLILVLLLAYVTLETKRVFQGAVMVIEPLTVAENYAYSAVWLVFALALLVAGLALKRAYIRFGGLAVMVLTVLKVFLWDLQDLDGLYRIASFIGLGLCLVGIGYLYTRFAEKPEAEVRP